MKRKILPLLVVLFVVLLAMPVLASPQLQINENNLSLTTAPVIKDGTMLVQLDTIGKVIGADIDVKYNRYIKISKNESLLELIVGENVAHLNGNTVSAPQVPYINENGKIMVPLRFVWESLGGEVQWISATSTASLVYEETRAGLTANELMVKSSNEAQKFDNYTASGDMKMSLAMEGIDDPSAPDKIDMDVDFTSYYQKEPLAVYTNQNMKMQGLPEMPAELQSMNVESLIKDNAIYTNMPGTGWVKMEIPGMDIENLIKQTTSLDPAGLLQLMKDTGIIACYGNDISRDGKDYWVINVTMDNAKYMEQINKMLPMANLPESADMKSLFDNSLFDMYYRMYVDKDNYLNTLTDLDCSLNMSVPVPDQASPGQKLSMDMQMSGSLKIDNFNAGMELPDVSSAKDLSEIVPVETTDN
ncbi:MAG: copper amine oxidase N-terminal domain-containing protein [Syntrophomonadaceae bacterium]|nr:copper amine oxidase N-terminal domain-containing protein [Syntrophomonadaceae bacterium]MDD3888368.1 copper amine oxidase N-terminal domain-containing protein [Syntrophomonadaceae bacterium]MDD4548873.1 copper amine oxidase N-terminal domain-containing protein [Syntrophomonadaceae bacterium]